MREFSEIKILWAINKSPARVGTFDTNNKISSHEFEAYWW